MKTVEAAKNRKDLDAMFQTLTEDVIFQGQGEMDGQRCGLFGRNR